MLAPSQKLRIIVGGMVGQFPLGGVAWDYLHYVLGLHELGHEVYYDENTYTWPYDPIKQEPTNDGTYAAGFIGGFFQKYAPELSERWHYNLLMEKSLGMSRERFDEVAATADIYLNVSGVCLLPEKLNPRCRKVFMDTDPGFNQIGLYDLVQKEGKDCKRYKEVAGHDCILTYAENITSADCHLPKLDLKWVPTRPIATLSHWDWCRGAKPRDEAFTTVMTLDFSAKLKSLDYDGKSYYDKRPEFEKFIDLPLKTKAILRPAIGRNKGLERILEKGWQVSPAYPVSDTPEHYQQFIADSFGEWSIAKNVYAEPNTGWFSCRTCCYLAAGRPAVVEDTAWSKFIPSGQGVIGFRTMDEAAAGLEAVRANYAHHQQAAYEVARDYLSPQAVLTPMVEHIME
jgi:hypothetical protein